MQLLLRSISYGLLAVSMMPGVSGALSVQSEDVKAFDGLGFSYEGEIAKSLQTKLKTYFSEFSGGQTSDLQNYVVQLSALMESKGKVVSDYRFYGYKNGDLVVDDLADLMSGAKSGDTFKGIISYRVLVDGAPEKSSE